jgi:uncharacterized membrane protein YedE/YeeE
MIALAAAFVSGALFALGLGVGGMTQPAKVIGFLDVAGPWDPSLAFVMLGAVGAYGIAFRLIRRRTRPVLASAFSIPGRRDVDARLVGGAALFGVGWGLAGYCPGPGIVSLVAGATPVVVFVSAMLVGMRAADGLAAPRGEAVRRAGAHLRPQEGT